MHVSYEARQVIYNFADALGADDGVNAEWLVSPALDALFDFIGKLERRPLNRQDPPVNEMGATRKYLHALTADELDERIRQEARARELEGSLNRQGPPLKREASTPEMEVRPESFSPESVEHQSLLGWISETAIRQVAEHDKTWPVNVAKECSDTYHFPVYAGAQQDTDFKENVKAWFHDYSRGLDTAGMSEAGFFDDLYHDICAGKMDALEALMEAWDYVGPSNPEMRGEIMELLRGRAVSLFVEPPAGHHED